jgi:hypothetical protein
MFDTIRKYDYILSKKLTENSWFVVLQNNILNIEFCYIQKVFEKHLSIYDD